MLNHERNELERFIDDHGVADTVETLADILTDRARTERMPESRAAASRYAARLRGVGQITPDNVVNVISQCQNVATGRLKEALSTKRIQDAIDKGES